MGKRSEFARRPMDDYPTIDPRAVDVLAPFLGKVRTYAEPCAGDGRLVEHLSRLGLHCAYAGDIVDGLDALAITWFGDVDAIITNPPWTRAILHEMIVHFQKIAPTWLLFDADWAHTKQCGPYMDRCSHIVSVGRLKWIEGTKQTGKDNCAWYRFDRWHGGGPRFFPQMREAA